MIGVVDYRMGNLGSVLRGLARAGTEAERLERPLPPARMQQRYQALVVPGDGAFGEAMAHLAEQGWVEALRGWIAGDRPLLGICLGLQLLFERSEERFDQDEPQGLDLLPGRVVRFAPELKAPQMGWNQAEPTRPHPIWEGIALGESFYFVHSYYVQPAREEDVLAWTEYGAPFASAVGRGRLVALQFHPEKSGAAGTRLLANFVRWVAEGAPIEPGGDRLWS